MSRQKLFKNLKLQEKYMMFLTEMYDFKETVSKTSKYKVMVGELKGRARYFFLGKRGAVRICETNTYTKSMDFSSVISKAFEQWNEKRLANDSL